MRRWLDLAQGRQRVGLRPHRDVALPLEYGVAYDRVLAAVERALGASVAIDDRAGGTIEAAFGLVNSERVRCTLRPAGAGATGVRIEAFFPAGSAVRERSAAVDALAHALEREATGAR